MIQDASNAPALQLDIKITQKQTNLLASTAAIPSSKITINAANLSDQFAQNLWYNFIQGRPK